MWIVIEKCVNSFSTRQLLKALTRARSLAYFFLPFIHAGIDWAHTTTTMARTKARNGWVLNRAICAEGNNNKTFWREMVQEEKNHTREKRQARPTQSERWNERLLRLREKSNLVAWVCEFKKKVQWKVDFSQLFRFFSRIQINLWADKLSVPDSIFDLFDCSAHDCVQMSLQMPLLSRSLLISMYCWAVLRFFSGAAAKQLEAAHNILNQLEL